MAAKLSTLDSSKFTRLFLRSLSKVKPRTPVSTGEIAERTRRIKMAADYAMARVVGPEKAWSRSVLFKLVHKRARNRRWRREKKIRARKTQKKPRSGEVEEQVEKLRRVVPGGKSMEVCVLMEETAHYVDCLSTQVKLLQAITNLCSK